MADARANVTSALQDCSKRISDSPVGLGPIEERCPELSAALQSADLRPLIIESSRAQLTAQSLAQLSGLILPAAGPAPSVSALQPVLQQLRATPAPGRSWWRRLLEWLSEHFVEKQQPDARPWLSGILRFLPKVQWLAKIIMWVTLIALPVAVLIIVRREAKAMGRRSKDATAPSGDPGGSGPAESRLALLRQLPLAQRPAQLFAMLIARLVAAGRLPPDRSLTHREVVRRALLDDAEQRRLIESLARLSERQLYAGVPAAPTGLDELVARCEDLYITGWALRSPR
jgi:hypothetical protein